MPEKEKKDNWFMRPMSLKAFAVLVISVFVLYFMDVLINHVYDTDVYFLVASGREILQNGIPHENVWIIDKGCSIVIQQWLYDIIVAKFDQYGAVGFISFLLIEMAAMFGCMWVFLGLRNVNKWFRALLIGFILLFCQSYMFSLRPELITMILILVECIGLERYRDTGKFSWLLLFPLSVLLEINLHGAMWMFHFAVLAAYVIYAFYALGVEHDNLKVKDSKLWISVILSVIVLFINPYGVDMVTYVSNAYLSHAFRYLLPSEMGKPAVLSGFNIVLIFGIVFLLLSYKGKVLRSSTVNICCGFMLLGAIYVRNNVFAVFIFLFVFRDFVEYAKQHADKIDWRKDVQNYLWCILIFANLFFIGEFCCDMVEFVKVPTIASAYKSHAGMYEYIAEHGDSDTRTFTGFNNGAYFEYCGLKNVYIDARPELYMKVFNGKKDILADYSMFAMYGIDHGGEIETTKDNVDDWFESYDFDYVVVDIAAEAFLHGYMMNRTDYQVVPDVGSESSLLYEKVL